MTDNYIRTQLLLILLRRKVTEWATDVWQEGNIWMVYLCTAMSLTASGTCTGHYLRGHNGRRNQSSSNVCQRPSASWTSADWAFPLEAPLATQTFCRTTNNSQRSSKAMQQDGFSKCARLAAHCLHVACYVMRVWEKRQQLTSSSHFHASVHGSGASQQFSTDAYSLRHRSWSRRSGYNIFWKNPRILIFCVTDA